MIDGARHDLDRVATKLPEPELWEIGDRPALVAEYGDSEMTQIVWHQRGRLFNLQWHSVKDEGIAAAENAVDIVGSW